MRTAILKTGVACFWALAFSALAQAAPQIVFSLPKGSKGKNASLSSQILCAERLKDVSVARSVTLHLNDAGVAIVEKFTKPLVGKSMEYSICGGKNQRVKIAEPLTSNRLTLGLLPDAKIDCLSPKQTCE